MNVEYKTKIYIYFHDIRIEKKNFLNPKSKVVRYGRLSPTVALTFLKLFSISIEVWRRGVYRRYRFHSRSAPASGSANVVCRYCRDTNTLYTALLRGATTSCGDPRRRQTNNKSPNKRRGGGTSLIVAKPAKGLQRADRALAQLKRNSRGVTRRARYLRLRSDTSLNIQISNCITAVRCTLWNNKIFSGFRTDVGEKQSFDRLKNRILHFN